MKNSQQDSMYVLIKIIKLIPSASPQGAINLEVAEEAK